MAVNQLSSAVYHEHIKDKMDLLQEQLVVKYLRQCRHPQTANMLLGVVNRVEFKIDKVSLRRALHNLTVYHQKKGWNNHYGRQVCLIAQTEKCPITKVTVGWYALMPDFNQLPLFKETPAAAGGAPLGDKGRAVATTI